MPDTSRNQYSSSSLVPGDLVFLDAFLCGEESPHVADEAADDRGRKGQRYADRLRQAVHHIRERNPDQSRDRDDDNISLQQHGETFRGACEQGGVSFGTTRLDIRRPSTRAGKSQTKTFCVRN
jgi:hypothetical protein